MSLIILHLWLVFVSGRHKGSMWEPELAQISQSVICKVTLNKILPIRHSMPLHL